MNLYELKKAYRDKVTDYENLKSVKSHKELLALYKEIKELQYRITQEELKLAQQQA